MRSTAVSAAMFPLVTGGVGGKPLPKRADPPSNRPGQPTSGMADRLDRLLLTVPVPTLEAGAEWIQEVQIRRRVRT